MTRALVISDIHANLPALEAVLADAAEQGYDAAWCLGDLVGYGPCPNECIDAIRDLPELVCLMGNHDAAMLGRIDIDSFNREAGQSALWTQNTLTEDSRAFLQSLQVKAEVDRVTLAHGSPRNPVWEYLVDIYTARDNFNHFTTDSCLVGHTHVPLAYELRENPRRAVLTQFVGPAFYHIHGRTILNPGSVGQPRDYDPRASYAIYSVEEEAFEIHRVPYDIAAAQKWILEAGLPGRHAERLEFGW